MIMGYWDGNGYPDLVVGDASIMTLEVRYMMSSTGNWYDYCKPLDTKNKILPDKSEPPVGDEHADDCVADFMKTSQSFFNCYYGATTAGKADDGMRNYVNLIYPELNVLSARVGWHILTWEKYCAEIDAGYPLILHVDPDGEGGTTHSVTAIGYSDQGGTKLYGCYNTWQTKVKWYEWAPVSVGQPWGVGEGNIFRIGEVDVFVPGEYPTIQAAIDASIGGNVIWVAPGTYYENLDYQGKNLTVISEQGAWSTVIHGDGTTSVVTFANWEDSDAVLDGFTVMNGHAATGGGIYVGEYSQATIRNNIICDNTADDFGGGLYCWYSNPFIINNIFYDNTAGQSGGGVGCQNISAPIIVNNTFYSNSAGAKGGGIFSESFISNITVTNSILWNNSAPTGAQMNFGGSSTVTYSDVQGGWTGAGNIDADPLFADAAQADFHLQYGSPCRDAATNTPAALPEHDCEGDARECHAAVDMGADEFYNHLYVTGNFTPGGSIVGKFVGLPGTSPVGLWFGSGVLDPPMSTAFGPFYLAPPWVGPMVLFPIPGNGIEAIPATMPGSPPGPYALPMQALIGDEFTNLFIMNVN
jgi:hypothetical protein